MRVVQFSQGGWYSFKMVYPSNSDERLVQNGLPLSFIMKIGMNDIPIWTEIHLYIVIVGATFDSGTTKACNRDHYQ